MSRRYIGSLIDAFNTLKVANAPTIGTAGATIAKVCVSFTAPSCVGGGAITSYTAVSCPCFKTGTGTTSPITVACLTNCTAYTFKVSANNAFGPSAFSAASSSVTPSASGNLAIFALARTPCVSAIRNKYIFSGCLNSSATASTQAAFYSSAAGNSTIGIFALGANSCGSGTNIRNKYTYSSCANALATAASAASYLGSAAGNSTAGIFALGFKTAASTTRDKYTYSGCVVTSGTAASTASYIGSAVGNSTVGIFALGGFSGSTTRNKYTYAGCGNASATAASSSSYGGSAASNGTCGVNI
jgi:hypothetical protein